jgi:hypothetical protein
MSQLERAQKIHNNAVAAGLNPLAVPRSQPEDNLRKYANNLKAQLPRTQNRPYVPPLLISQLFPRLPTTSRRKQRKHRKATRRHRRR